MRKAISCLLIVLILINFILCNNAYADADPDELKKTSPLLGNTTSSNTIGESIIDGDNISEGSGGEQKSMALSALTVSAIGTVAGILARLVNIVIALQVDLAMGFLSHGQETDSSGNQTNPFWISIDRMVYNRVSLFDINYLNMNDTYNVGSTTITSNSGNIAIKQSVTRVYYISRIISIALSLLVLIYIGIRMAISTVASDQAKYKKMLISWVESIAILFVMIYLISIIILIGERLTGMFYDIRCQLLDSGEQLFEDTVRSEAWSGLFEKSGFDLAIWSIIYWCLLFMEIKFFFLYARRFLMVGLLITVSPLIIITYSMDKAGDGQAQAFNAWMKEFVISVLIQPLHGLIYLVIVFTANTIAAKSPVVALGLLLAMSTVEKMVRVIFDVKGSEVVREMNFLKKRR